MGTGLQEHSTWAIDRISENIAILENIKTLESSSVFLHELPQGVAPGDTLVWENGTWRFDHEETARRAKKIDELWKRIKGRL